jgi:hypothetical protein
MQEGVVMAGQLIVPLKRHEHVVDVIPYIDKIGQPGMEVVFLLPLPAQYLNWSRDWQMRREADIRTRLAIGLPPGYRWEHPKSTCQGRYFSVCEHFWENEKHAYEEKLFPVCEGLRRMGSEVTVNLYNRGGLRRVLRNYRLSGDRYLIIMPCGIGPRVKTLLCRKLSIFRFAKASIYTPVLLLSTKYK